MTAPPTLVVDACMVIKWVLNEKHRAALGVGGSGKGTREKGTPGDLSPQQATKAFDPLVGELAGAGGFGQRRPTYYDCLYLALDRQCDLITADERFFRGVRLAFPFVRLLQDL